MNIHSIEMDKHAPGIVVVTAEDHSQIRYRMGNDGVLRPGRVWSCLTPPEVRPGATVLLFIPFPDGCPEILKIEDY